ncbi:hypothetical protein MCOR25_008723 [Pyricularia grisea]|nr:hypothetical protein MCOR25_008723 [Pyricularia grisea]
MPSQAVFFYLYIIFYLYHPADVWERTKKTKTNEKQKGLSARYLQGPQKAWRLWSNFVVGVADAKNQQRVVFENKHCHFRLLFIGASAGVVGSIGSYCELRSAQFSMEGCQFFIYIDVMQDQVFRWPSLSFLLRKK